MGAKNNYVSIQPLHFDLTAYEHIDNLNFGKINEQIKTTSYDGLNSSAAAVVLGLFAILSYSFTPQQKCMASHFDVFRAKINPTQRSSKSFYCVIIC